MLAIGDSVLEEGGESSIYYRAVRFESIHGGDKCCGFRILGANTRLFQPPTTVPKDICTVVTHTNIFTTHNSPFSGHTEE